MATCWDIVTLQDILAEIVGDLGAQPAALRGDILPQVDGSYVIAGSTSIRDINRTLRWSLPTDGPRTLNGVIVEYLEAIPEAGTSLMLGEIIRWKSCRPPKTPCALRACGRPAKPSGVRSTPGSWSGTVVART